MWLAVLAVAFLPACLLIAIALVRINWSPGRYKVIFRCGPAGRLLGIATALLVTFATDARAEEACPLTPGDHALLMKRYEEVIKAFGAKVTFGEFDPYVPQRLLGPHTYKGMPLPDTAGWNADQQRWVPRQPEIYNHTPAADVRAHYPAYTHAIIGAIKMHMAARSLVVIGFENAALKTYLTWKYDRWSVGKGSGPKRILSQAQAEERCRNYLTTMVGKELDGLVALEGPFFDEQRPNFSSHPLHCDRTTECWPRWVARFWRKSGAVLSTDYVAECQLDPVLGPIEIRTDAGLYSPTPPVKPQIGESRAREIALLAAEPIADYFGLPKVDFGSPVLKDIRLAIMGGPDGTSAIKGFGPLPNGLKVDTYEGTPLVWHAEFELDSRRITQDSRRGAYRMWIEINAQNGHLLGINGIQVRE